MAEGLGREARQLARAHRTGHDQLVDELDAGGVGLLLQGHGLVRAQDLVLHQRARQPREHGWLDGLGWERCGSHNCFSGRCIPCLVTAMMRLGRSPDKGGDAPFGRTADAGETNGRDSGTDPTREAVRR
jgi:hypothetical protein